MIHYVYILKSDKSPAKHYVGYTTNLEQRLSKHNSNQTVFSRRYAPWHIETYIGFNNKQLALSFERYLKKGSGHAFLRKRLINQHIQN